MRNPPAHPEDYEIFLLSRVHEAWLRTADAEGSVAHGLEITARVITCAALIMVSVFAAFVVSDNIVVKMLGLGLAVSVLVDATAEGAGEGERGVTSRPAAKE